MCKLNFRNKPTTDFTLDSAAYFAINAPKKHDDNWYIWRVRSLLNDDDKYTDETICNALNKAIERNT